MSAVDGAPRRYTVKEATAWLAAQGVEVDRETVRRWSQAGKLPARRIGGRWYIAERDLERWIGDGVEQD